MITLKNKNSTLTLPKLAIGTSFLGEAKDLAHEFKIMDAFFKSSNFVDTARVYSNWSQNGSGGSEEVIGNYLKDRGERGTIISTKGGHPFSPDRSDNRCDSKSILADIDQSLKFLRRDMVDIYFLHRDGGNNLFDTMSCLSGLVKSGKVRHLGASNWSHARIMEANALAEKEGLFGFEISQICWSLGGTESERWGDPTLICMDDAEEQAYVHGKIPIMAYSSQGRGYFAKKLNGEELNEKTKKRYDHLVNQSRLERVKELMATHNCSATEIVLSYLLSNKIPTCPVVGFSKLSQLEETLKAQNLNLTQQEIEFLKNGVGEN